MHDTGVCRCCAHPRIVHSYGCRSSNGPSISGIGVNGIEFNTVDGWVPVTRDQVEDMVEQGVPLPETN